MKIGRILKKKLDILPSIDVGRNSPIYSIRRNIRNNWINVSYKSFKEERRSLKGNLRSKQ